MFAYVASVLLDGGVPYRDVWDHKAPLVYFLDAAGLLIGGRSLVGIWALQWIGYVIAALAGYALLARAFGAPAALFGSAAWLLTAPHAFLVDTYFMGPVQVFAAPLQFVALWLALRSPRHVRTDAAIGALGALAVLLTPTLAGTWIALAACFAWIRRPSVAAMAAGAAVVLALVIAYFALNGALAHLFDQVLRYNAAYSASATWSSRVDALRYGVALTGASGGAYLALGGWVLAAWLLARRQLVGAARSLAIVAVIALPVEIALASTSGRQYPYYFLAWLPAIAILAALAARWLETSVVLRLAWHAPLRPATLTTVLLGAAVLVMAIPSTALVTRIAASREDGIARAGIEYVRANTADADEVLIWGARTEVALLADRRMPTRFVYQYAPLYTRGYSTDAHVDELIAQLSARPPAVIVDASRDSALSPRLAPGAAAFDTGDPLYRVPPAIDRVAGFVSSRYVHAGTVEPRGWPVYRLRQ